MMRPDLFDGAVSNEKNESIGQNKGSPYNAQQWDADLQNAGKQGERGGSFWDAEACEMAEIDYAIQQFDGSSHQFGGIYDDSSSIADQDMMIREEKNHCTKVSTEGEAGLVFHELDWAQIGQTINKCSSEEFEMGGSNFDPIDHRRVTIENTGNSACDVNGLGNDAFVAEDLVEDLVGPVNQGVCDVFREFNGSDLKDGTDNEVHSAIQPNQFQSGESDVAAIHLTQWIKREKTRSNQNPNSSILRKINVAYGIGKLLKSSAALECFTADNLIVIEDSKNDAGWEVVGIHMIIPPLSLHLVSKSGMLKMNPQQVRNNSEIQGGDEINGRDVSAVMMNNTTSVPEEELNPGLDEIQRCLTFGQLIHFLFSGDQAQKVNIERTNTDNANDTDAVRPTKRQTSLSQATIVSSETQGANTSNCRRASRGSLQFRSLAHYGCPTNISQLAGDLLSCGDELFRSDNAFKSLKEATDEVHLLLLEPNKFLFQGSHHGKIMIGTKNRLFGRNDESSKILDAYHRVASRGGSEIAIVRGFSGTGKTRLVQTVGDDIRFAGGYFSERKFEEISSQSCLNVTLSAFDDILIQIAQLKSLEQRNAICSLLTVEFGSSFHFLAEILPSVRLLSSLDAAAISERQIDSNVNIISLCFTLQRFMKVISASAGPGVLFLDDIQWADSTSLMLVHSILSNIDNLLFVGSYRSNDIQNGGQHVSDFLSTLAKLNATVTNIDLEGVAEDDVNLMISDALGIVPRLCIPLSKVVHRKTNGSPFFVKEFIRTLVERGLVEYSLREKRWLWDLDAISSQPITDNVLQLITSKMNTLSENAQMALKVASCFGMKVLASVVQSLSRNQQYSSLQVNIDRAVEEGLIDFDGVHYKFAHDKVRQASYELISAHDRSQYHFEVGLVLVGSCIGQDEHKNNDFLFATVEQLNYGAPSLLNDSNLRTSIARLNYKAGLAAMKSWNYIGALTYMKAAYCFLPHNSWTTDYDLSLGIHFELANTAYSNGAIDVAKLAIHQIDQEGKCPDDKMDAYNLLVTILHHHQENLTLAMDTCIKALKMLGENVPYNTGFPGIMQFFRLVSTRLNTSHTSNSSMLNMPRTEDKRTMLIMRFYYQLALVSYSKCLNMPGKFRGVLCVYYISRWVSYVLDKRIVCRYTPVALAFYSASMVHGIVHGFDEPSCREAYRLGKVALKLLNDNKDQNELPGTYLVMYGFAGVLFEPIQVMVDMHMQAYQVGMQLGNTSDAFYNVCFLIPRMIECGTNVDLVAKEIHFFQQLAKTHDHPVLAKYMQCFESEIILLRDSKPGSHTISLDESDELKITDYMAIQICSLIMPAFFLGQLERVAFLAKKWDNLHADERERQPYRCIMVNFYYGLSCAIMHRKKESRKHMSTLKAAISYLAKASRLSNWNFGAMHLLLIAEKFSIMRDNYNAELQYAGAIKAAEASKMPHIEGLACELSARHHHRIKLNNKAKELFKQAETCYVRWGSPKMVQSVRGQLLLLEQTSSSEIIQTTKSRVSLVEKAKNVMKAS